MLSDHTLNWKSVTDIPKKVPQIWKLNNTPVNNTWTKKEKKLHWDNFFEPIIFAKTKSLMI